MRGHDPRLFPVWPQRVLGLPVPRMGARQLPQNLQPLQRYGTLVPLTIFRYNLTSKHSLIHICTVTYIALKLSIAKYSYDRFLFLGSHLHRLPFHPPIMEHRASWVDNPLCCYRFSYLIYTRCMLIIGRLRKARKPQRLTWKLLFEHIVINMCVWPSGKPVIRDVSVFVTQIC